MANPYAAKGPSQFWRTAVADIDPSDVRPIPFNRFRIEPADKIGTAGSCFAQHVSRYIMNMDDAYFLQVEKSPLDQPIFSARYGNIYTAAQLLQLFLEATGKLEVPPIALQRPDGRWVDAFRPTTYEEGFTSPDDVAAERLRHLAAVRQLFVECSVFVFTLGLIEGWTTTDGRFVFPIHPQVVSNQPLASNVRFHRYSYEEVRADSETFLKELRAINPHARVITTVSPVPLTATFTDEHVLSATVYSKSLLRTVCGSISESTPNAFYFPSYEIISDHYNGGRYYGDNKRNVTDTGVAHVMRVFRATYFDFNLAAIPPSKPSGANKMLADACSNGITCDEEAYGTNVGF